jgi:hypothetical protein
MDQSIRPFLALNAMPLKRHLSEQETKELVMSQSSFAQIVPDAYRTVSAVEAYVRGCGLEKPLIELVKMRAS